MKNKTNILDLYLTYSTRAVLWSPFFLEKRATLMVIMLSSPEVKDPIISGPGNRSI